MLKRKIRASSFLTSGFSTLLLLVLIGWNSRKEDKLLVFFRNTVNQSPATAAARSFMVLAQKNNMEVDTTSNTAYISEDSLKNYRAVVFLSTSPDVLETWQQNEFER